ncbi:MAG: ferrous iron transport protein B [bacterium]
MDESRISPVRTSSPNREGQRGMCCALVGNPNSGKTSIFNVLTGTRQRVANYPGVTVAIKEGTTRHGDRDLRIVDLPGTYSLMAYSAEEMIVQAYLIDQRPDVAINIVDATNLERNLYLTAQLIELGVKIVVALNMSDEARNRGISIDHNKLTQLLGIPFVPTIANRGVGTRELLETAVAVADGSSPVVHEVPVHYGEDIEHQIELLQTELDLVPEIVERYGKRWLAIHLLEGDKTITEVIAPTKHGKTILEVRDISVQHLKHLLKEDVSAIFAERRYGFVRGAVRETVSMSVKDKIRVTDAIDAVVTHRLFGIPIFIGFLWLMFEATFSLGEIPMGWIEAGVGWLGGVVSAAVPEGLLRGLLVDGVIDGVGSVLVFLPNILILFFFISLMEDTGYMARAAFIMDRVMHTLGLHGKSFIPMVMGFGCNVPAIMATRLLENRSDRLLTILVNPLMSCSARLPVYILLAGTFFASHATLVIFGMYALGVALAAGVGQIFRRVLFRGEAMPFVMELPPYRIPLLRAVLIHMWDRAAIFVRKVAVVILLASIVIWSLCSFPRYFPGAAELTNAIQELEQVGPREDVSAKLARIRTQFNEEQLRHSYGGKIGRLIAPIIHPMGLDWKAGLALLTGVAAKETVVSTLGVLYHAGRDSDEGNEGLRAALRKSGLTPASALAMMVIVLIYVPCFGTVAVIRRETGSWKWPAFAVGYACMLAWITAFLIFQVARLFLSSGVS